jgi:hypothetical protein
VEVRWHEKFAGERGQQSPDEEQPSVRNAALRSECPIPFGYAPTSSMRSRRPSFANSEPRR